MRRKKSRGRGRGKGGQGRWYALGLAGALALGWTLTRGESQDPNAPEGEPMALSAPAVGEGGEAPAKPAGAAPPELVAAFGRLGQDDIHPLLDLRRLAIEFAETQAGARARRALDGEANRCLSEARDQGKGAYPRLKAMTRAYVATLGSQTRRALREEAESLSQAALAAAGCPLVKVYTVKPGDILARIARRHKTEYRLIKRLSGVTRDFLKVGQKLRVPQGKSEVVIFKGQFELLVMLDGCLLRAFDVATGKHGRTPEGRFVIGTKTVNPTWYSPNGGVYPFGNENNILGTRWMAFKDTAQHQGFGIHGTKFPESIGTEASMGCIRMRNAEVEVVYDLIPGGSKVRIVK
tara:strand:+ start:1303 stop:2352 length:1050 start_codon:yes stop_codon:yes gene_type:complete